jgi:hypothetical protein
VRLGLCNAEQDSLPINTVGNFCYEDNTRHSCAADETCKGLYALLFFGWFVGLKLFLFSSQLVARAHHALLAIRVRLQAIATLAERWCATIGIVSVGE